MDWDDDSIADIIAGDTNGKIVFLRGKIIDGRHLLEKGRFIAGKDGDIDVGERAAPDVHDFNGDGKKDLIVGNMDGKILVYINFGTDSDPRFDHPELLKVSGEVFDAGTRSAPRVFDWNGDALPDILVGEMEGHVYLLINRGAPSQPEFMEYGKLFTNDGRLLRFPDPSGVPRSRLAVTDWNGDGLRDILIGGGTGRIMLYLSSIEEDRSLSAFINMMVSSSTETYREIRMKVKKRISAARASFGRRAGR